ncbi:hypothetical protein CRG98_040604 [Punica granatum]|uniref:RNase H type-1 domain-containing protein n=1 Tax=Punica granatum TaxID=22663 RepID=A0A2I0I6G4_PUNGR|nr:hypothetical protein CRG98_040604 [Punica granatum]
MHIRPRQWSLCYQGTGLLAWFKEANIELVPRDDNMLANALGKCPATPPPEIEILLIEHPGYSSTYTPIEILQVNNADNWMSPIVRFIQTSALPSDPKEAKGIRALALKYIIIDGILYKRGYPS